MWSSIFARPDPGGRAGSTRCLRIMLSRDEIAQGDDQMPTVLRKYGFRFHFYSADRYEPPHIHIDGNGGEARSGLMM
ncbi:DUF4160 domain-containing protein [Rhizobium sp. RU36D]|uniref:DUF4160 domain-containing protein n=1 Tax=Rhizobium sp. RU36D TaxID=1907415 RepID=UPI0032AFF211